MGIKQRVLGRIMQWWARHGGLAQFHHPTGAVGHVAGWIMGRRSSNVARNRWAVQLLDVQPTDRVIELGCGPGVAIAALATRAIRGLVVGVDHSQVMIRQARRRLHRVRVGGPRAAEPGWLFPAATALALDFIIEPGNALRGSNFILKVDASTLPPGSTFTLYLKKPNRKSASSSSIRSSVEPRFT